MVAPGLVLAGTYIVGFFIAKETTEEMSEIKGFLGKLSVLLLSASAAITLTGIGISPLFSLISGAALIACIISKKLFFLIAGLGFSARPELIFPMLAFVSFAYAAGHYKKGLKAFLFAKKWDFLLSAVLLVALWLTKSVLA